MQKYGMTYRKNAKNETQFFKYAFECNEYSFCVFASDDVINSILSNFDVSIRKIYADVTFKICPIGIFTQALIVFGEIFGYVRSLKIFLKSFNPN